MIEESRTFAASTDSVAAARHFVTERLGAAGTDTHDVVALLVSELATNALVHGGTGFTLVVRLDGDRLRVSVTDGGEGTPQARRPAPEDLSGRGLLLVGRLADHWGVVPGADDGKTVWFELAVPDRSSPPTETSARASPRAHRLPSRLGSAAREP